MTRTRALARISRENDTITAAFQHKRAERSIKNGQIERGKAGFVEIYGYANI